MKARQISDITLPTRAALRDVHLASHRLHEVYQCSMHLFKMLCMSALTHFALKPRARLLLRHLQSQEACTKHNKLASLSLFGTRAGCQQLIITRDTA